MQRIGDHHVDGALNLLRRFGQIDEIRRFHRFAHPVGDGVGRKREPHIIERLVQFGRDMVRPVLVADGGDRGDATIGRHPAPIVGFAQERVHPLQRALAHARRLPQPDRGAEDQHVGCEHLLADHRPFVAVSLARGHAWPDVIIGKRQDLAVDIFLFHRRGDEVEHVAGRRCAPVGAGLERGVQCNGFHLHPLDLHPAAVFWRGLLGSRRSAVAVSVTACPGSRLKAAPDSQPCPSGFVPGRGGGGGGKFFGTSAALRGYPRIDTEER